MKRVLMLLVLIVLSGIMDTHHVSAAGAWQLVKDSDGIKSYSRTVEGSDILEFKAITVLDTKMENIGQVVRDVDSYTQWMAQCKAARLLKKFNENDLMLHIVLAMPWPVSDRDLVITGKTVYDLSKARGIVTLSMVKNSDVPVGSNIVRMTEFTGVYVFEYLTRDKTGVIYSYTANPGGKIPTGIINLFSKSLLHDTLTGLREMVKKSKYIKGGETSNDRKIFDTILKDKAKVRTIVKARLLEYCKDVEFLERASTDENVVNHLIRGDGTILEMVFYSWGSRDKIEKVTSAILKIHAKKFSGDQALIDRIAGDKQLIACIIDGKKANGKSALEIFNGYLKR